MYEWRAASCIRLFACWAPVPLANTEVIEMITLAQLWQTGPVDTAMAFGFGQGALVNTEKPRYSAAGKHCASPSDRSPSTLGQEAPGTVQLGSLVVGRSVPVWSEWRSALVIVKPDTVIAWHRKAFRLFW